MEPQSDFLPPRQSANATCPANVASMLEVLSGSAVPQVPANVSIHV